MKELLKNLGIFILLIGVICLVIYATTALKSNWLLVTGLVLEVIGILAYILTQKFIE